MYKSLNKTKHTRSELDTHETRKRVASANAILKHYKSSSLITLKRHASVLDFLKAYLVSWCMIKKKIHKLDNSWCVYIHIAHALKRLRKLQICMIYHIS